MARAVVLLASVALLLGCASDARSIKLADVDLGEMSTVQEIRGRLSAEDGPAFARYVVRHYIASASFCGRSLFHSDGKSPETIGEAIDLTLARDAEERRAAEEASRPKQPCQLAEDSWDDLTSEKDMLIDAQALLAAEHGEAAERLSAWKSIQTRIADVDSRLLDLKPRVFDCSG